VYKCAGEVSFYFQLKVNTLELLSFASNKKSREIMLERRGGRITHLKHLKLDLLSVVI
jgi:hypothetical protein